MRVYLVFSLSFACITSRYMFFSFQDLLLHNIIIYIVFNGVYSNIIIYAGSIIFRRVDVEKSFTNVANFVLFGVYENQRQLQL